MVPIRGALKEAWLKGANSVNYLRASSCLVTEEAFTASMQSLPLPAGTTALP